MNYFESFYASLFYSRKNHGTPAAPTPFNGNLLLSISLFVFVASIIGILVLIFPEIGDSIEDMLKDIFGRRRGKTIGRFLAIIGIALFYPFVRYTIGTPSKYQKIMSDCEKMSGEELKKVSRKGTIFVAVTLGSWIIPMLIWGVKSLL